MRRRLIVLDSSLLEDPREFVRIFVHEVFHFVWLRLGNAERHGYESLLATEVRRRTRGELGWSSESRKRRLIPADLSERTRRWREYACESFCDTGAWLLSGCPRHEEFTLAGEFRKLRRRWMRAFIARRAFSV